MYTSITHRGQSLKDKMIENYYILNQIVQSIDTGILIIHDGRLIHVNNETRRISQRTYRDIERGLMDCIVPQYRILAIRSYFMVLRGLHDRLECFIDILLPSGAPKTVRCRFSRIRILESDAIFVSVHDFTNYSYPRTAGTPNGVLCRRFVSDYQQDFAAPYDFAVLLDEFHTIATMGIKFQSVTGYSRQKFLGRRFDTIPGLDPYMDVVQALQNMRNSESQSVHVTVRAAIRTADGRLARFSFTFLPVRFRAVKIRTCVLCRLLGYDSNYNKVPLADTAMQADSALKADQQYNFRGKTAIVAEDAEINFFLLRKILEKTGINILRAANGRECVEIFRQNPGVSLILMDMRMPVMDGYQAAAEILKADPKVPIIAQTAFDMMGERQRILDIGCADFVSKPIDRRLLLQSIAKVIR